MIIGCNPECDIVLKSKTVSGKHAVFIRKPPGYELEDLGSTGGTYINGRKISQAVILKDGDRIQMGESLFAFDSGVAEWEDDEFDLDSPNFAVIDVLDQNHKYSPSLALLAAQSRPLAILKRAKGRAELE